MLCRAASTALGGAPASSPDASDGAGRRRTFRRHRPGGVEKLGVLLVELGLVHRLERGGTLLDAVADNEGRRLIEPRLPLLRAVLVGKARGAVGGKRASSALPLIRASRAIDEIDVEALGRRRRPRARRRASSFGRRCRILAPGDIGGELPPESARVDGPGKAAQVVGRQHVEAVEVLGRSRRCVIWRRKAASSISVPGDSRRASSRNSNALSASFLAISSAWTRARWPAMLGSSERALMRISRSAASALRPSP